MFTPQEGSGIVEFVVKDGNGVGWEVGRKTESAKNYSNKSSSCQAKKYYYLTASKE